MSPVGDHRQYSTSISTVRVCPVLNTDLLLAGVSLIITVATHAVLCAQSPMKTAPSLLQRFKDTLLVHKLLCYEASNRDHGQAAIVQLLGLEGVELLFVVRLQAQGVEPGSNHAGLNTVLQSGVAASRHHILYDNRHHSSAQPYAVRLLLRVHSSLESLYMARAPIKHSIVMHSSLYS